jgi:pimeloyl-ACP methyl ester carboxylesterase
MGKFISINGKRFGTTVPGTASQQLYNNAYSKLSAVTTQEAIDELVDQVQGIIVVVPSDAWVEESNGTFTNTIKMRGVNENTNLDVSLYNDGTLSDDIKDYYDIMITQIRSGEKCVVITATEPSEVDFAIVLKGALNANENAFIDYTTMKETCDELSAKIQGINIDVFANKWVEGTDCFFTNTINVAGLTTEHVVDVTLFNENSVSDSVLEFYDENVTRIEVGSGAVIITANKACDTDFMICINGLLTYSSEIVIGYEELKEQCVDAADECIEAKEKCEDIFNQVRGLIIEVDTNDWVLSEDGIYTNTIVVDGVSEDTAADIYLYNEETVSADVKTFYDEKVTKIELLENKVVVSATEKCNSTFGMVLRGFVDVEVDTEATLNVKISNVDNMARQNLSSINKLNKDLEVERARITNLVALEESSETTDVERELTDIRVGADGTTYGSAGEAVRGQINQLSSEIDNLEPNNLHLVKTSTPIHNLINKYTLIPNKYVDNSGVENVSPSGFFYLTDYIRVNSLEVLYSRDIGLSCFYDSSKTFISSHSNFIDGVEVPENAMYIRCSIPETMIDSAFVGGSLSVPDDNGMIILSKNKQYESGWIKFTVPVNQTIVSTNDTGGELSDSQNYVDVECVLRLPPSYTPYGTPTKLLMVCHGAGRGVTFPHPEDGKAWIDLDSYNNLVNNFMANGYAVFDCNGYDNTMYGCSFWGAPKGVEAWKKAYDYVTDNYNVETSFSIFGFSMGGLTACHLAMNGFPNIKCVALASPVLDLEKCWESGQTTLMELGYGMSGAYDESKALGSNPMSHLITVGDKEYCLPKIPPIKVWYGSTEEGVAVNKNYAIRLVNAMKNSGSYAIYREWQGAGHEICYGENAMSNLEYYLWINRFNNNYYN